MKSNYKQLGQYIRAVDVKNDSVKKENLLGVSVQKKFIPSIANTNGTDFSKYKVVKRGQFTYIPDTSRRGDKIGLALLEDYDEGLVSNVYTVFEVVDKHQLIPEYLMLWFSRPEFDRYARFKSHGSVREIMDWDEMCKVELPVPSYEEQFQIVRSYKAIADRIALKQEINDNLEQQAQAMYAEMFGVPSSDCFNGVLSDISEITMGQSPDGKSYNEDGIGTVFFQGRAEFGDRFPTKRLFTTEPKRMARENDVLMSVRAPVGDLNVAHEDCCIGRGLGAIRSKDNHQSFVFYTLLSLRPQLNDNLAA